MAITITPTEAVHAVAEAIRALNAHKPIAAKRIALITKRVSNFHDTKVVYLDAQRVNTDAAVTELLGPRESYRGGVSSEMISDAVDRSFETFKQTSQYKDLTIAKRALTFAKKSAKSTRERISGTVSVLEYGLDDIRLTLKRNAEGQTHLPRGAWASRLLTEAEVALLSAMLVDGSNVLSDLDDLEIALSKSLKTTYGLI